MATMTNRAAYDLLGKIINLPPPDVVKRVELVLDAGQLVPVLRITTYVTPREVVGDEVKTEQHVYELVAIDEAG